MSWNFTGEKVKVWRDDKKGFPRYSVSVSSKNEDGSYNNAYQSVQFKKGVNFENGQLIDITQAFPTVRVWNDGSKHIVWVILGWVLSDARQAPSEPLPEGYESYAGSVEDIPF